MTLATSSPTRPTHVVSIELGEEVREPSLRGMTRRWKITPPNDAAAAELEGMNLPPLMKRLLAARGLTDATQVKQLIDPRLSDLCDPALMPGIDSAVRRLIDSIRRNESIVIYGDYDVDGITATAILYHVIKTLQPSARVRSYVPHRVEEGYGLNADALRQLKSEGAELVITVDCGITAIGPAQVAREIGLDLIITDHHEFRSQKPEVRSQNERSDANANDLLLLPSCVALVHPRLPGSQYPFGDLCGAGVAFKVAWHLARVWCNSDRVSESLQKTLVNMLPLVALGTIADVVPLLGENRILTAFGLRVIKQSPLIGLRALIEASGLADEKIDSERVGFALAPRLNACGRMGHASEAMTLFTDASPEQAREIANRLTQLNVERQRVERRIFDHAAQLAEDMGMTRDDHRVIVLAHESWHPGVVGIVCSRMVERFGRPVVLMNKSEQICKGSARSIDDYSIHDGLSAAAAHLTTFGGHAMAAGLSLPVENLAALVETLLSHANERIAVEHLTPSITIDCEATLPELERGAVEQMQRLSPFGRSHRAPSFLLRCASIVDPPKQMGANGRHLSLRVLQQSADEARLIRAVWWGAGERAQDFAAGMTIDAVIEPRLNEWNGRVSVEAEIRDARVCPR